MLHGNGESAKVGAWQMKGLHLAGLAAIDVAPI
jgi:hypothetical protein